jgi:hypothetical protein
MTHSNFQQQWLPYLIVSLGLASVANATVCSGKSSIREAFDASPAVVVGKVVEVAKFGGRTVILRERVFKGNLPRKFVVVGMTTGDMQLVYGQRYLIYAASAYRQDRFAVGQCGRTALVDQSEDEIKQLEKLSANQP